MGNSMAFVEVGDCAAVRPLLSCIIAFLPFLSFVPLALSFPFVPLA